MRRTPGGLLLIIAGVCFAIAIGSWWMQRVAFSPTSDSEVALSILGDEEIRAQIATIVASADAPELSQSPTQLKEFIEQIARIPDGAALMGDILENAHARLIGENDDLVLITADEQVVIVRDERVGEMTSLTLPVQEVGFLSGLDSAAGWLAIGASVLGLITLLAGIVLRPERGEATFALGVGLASLAGSLFVLGYLVPLAVLPAMSDSIWMGVFPRLANHHRTLTLGLAILALALAAVIVIGTNNRRQRRQHSTPLAVGRYREERSWSR